jgi:hypothetical protein
MAARRRSPSRQKGGAIELSFDSLTRPFVDAFSFDDYGSDIVTENGNYVKSIMDWYGDLTDEEQKDVLDVKNRARLYIIWSGILEGLLFAGIIMYLIWFAVLCGLGDLNQTFDFTHSFLNTHCGNDVVCEEYSLVADEAIKPRWLFLAMFICLASVYPITYIIVALLRQAGMLFDFEGTARRLLGELNVRARGNVAPKTATLFNWVTFPIRFVIMQNYVNLAVMYNLRHVIYDVIVFPFVLATCGVRDLWTLCLVGGVAAVWNLCIILAQRDNMFSLWMVRVEQIVYAKNQTPYTEGGRGRWFMPIFQAPLGAFLVCVILFHVFRVPHQSRTLIFDLFGAAVAVNIIIRLLHNVVRWYARDPRVRNNINKTSYTGVEVADIFIRFFAHIGSALYVLFAQHPLFVHVVLDLWDLLLISLPLIFLYHLNHADESNIARIIFPVSATLFY